MADNLISIAAAEHTITSVTIFKSKAEVVRTFDLNLKAGRNKVEIRGLSSSIDTNAIRVSGLTDGARLSDVVCTLATLTQVKRSSDTVEALRKLRVEKSKLEDNKKARTKEVELLHQYGATLGSQHMGPEQMVQFLETLLQRSREAANAAAEIDEKILAIDKQIDEINEESRKRRGTTRGEVTIIILADVTMQTQIRLTYIVDNVSWVPTYELHATTEKGKPSSTVSLHYRARITQSTGEDWKDTSLTLSTISSASVAKKIPSLHPVKIRPEVKIPTVHHVPPPRAARVRSARAAMPAPGASRSGSSLGMPTASAVAASFSSYNAAAQPDDDNEDEEFDLGFELPDEPATIVNETPVAISYSVHGKSTIPSDGIDHQVSVAILPFDAEISYVTVPRIEPLVYLECTVKNTSEYRLLAGPVTVILDDSYVSLASINNINTGDTFTCTLGDDSTTKVAYSRKSRVEKIGGGAFVEALSRTTWTVSITVHNKHQFPIESLIVREVIPTAEDTRIKVILRKPEELATAKEGQTVTLQSTGGVGKLTVGWDDSDEGKAGEKEGRFVWKWGVGSGEKVTLEAEWEIKAPSDLTYHEQIHPN